MDSQGVSLWLDSFQKRRDRFRAVSASQAGVLPGDPCVNQPVPKRKMLQKGIGVIVFGHLLQWLMKVISKNSYSIKSVCLPAIKSCFGFVCYLKILLVDISMWRYLGTVVNLLLIYPGISDTNIPSCSTVISFIAISPERNQKFSFEHIWWSHTC